MDDTYTLKPKALIQTEVMATETRIMNDGSLFVDFGRAAFGTLLVPSSEVLNRSSIVVHLGEKLTADGRIDRAPPGSVRYRRIEQKLKSCQNPGRITIPPDERNTGSSAIKMPDHIGEVYPFRYAEIEDAAHLDPSAFRQVCVHYPFDENASSFKSSDSILNAVWDLC
jgi:alpha-L-rhamnosidase